MKVKKNDKAYLQDFKIDIHSNKDILYQELALLFDKPKFLNLLSNLRKTYDIVKLLPLDNFIENIDDFYKKNYIEVKIDLSKYTKMPEIEESFHAFFLLLGGSPTNFLPEMLDAECNLICFEFNRPPHFVDAITQAICCGAVNDTYFKPTEAQSVNFEEMGAWPTLERVAIFVSPTSTYEEVKEEFRKAKDMMKTNKYLSYYQPRTDLTPNIRKYRHWYWERIKGKTYQAIADEWVDKHESENTTYLDVLKAVKTYEKLLTS